MENMIVLSSEKELKVLMSPIRQRIIRQMSREGKPVTSKYIADKLNISPSSAQHHIKQLQEIGIIEFDHSEVINGITARYLKLSEKNISIGTNINDDLNFIFNGLGIRCDANTLNGTYEVTRILKIPQNSFNLNLGRKEIQRFIDEQSQIAEMFIDKYSKKISETSEFLALLRKDDYSIYLPGRYFIITVSKFTLHSVYLI